MCVEKEFKNGDVLACTQPGSDARVTYVGPAPENSSCSVIVDRGVLRYANNKFLSHPKKEGWISIFQHKTSLDFCVTSHISGSEAEAIAYANKFGAKRLATIKIEY